MLLSVVFAQLKIFEVGALSVTFLVPLYLTFKCQQSNCVFALTTDKFRKAFYVVIGVRHWWTEIYFFFHVLTFSKNCCSLAVDVMKVLLERLYTVCTKACRTCRMREACRIYVACRPCKALEACWLVSFFCKICIYIYHCFLRFSNYTCYHPLF